LNKPTEVYRRITMGKRVNTTVKERKELLKELGYTEADMQKFWDENKEVNHKIRILSEAGRNWTDLTVYQMRELPTLKEKTLKQLEEKRQAEENERITKQKAEEYKKYYNEHFEEIMVNKIDNKEELTEKELRRLVFDYSISDTRGDKLRWTTPVSSVVELLGRNFMIDWQEGLTENQEDEFYDQPYEVEKHEYSQVITVTKWVKK
jgi:hypothetical protein